MKPDVRESLWNQQRADRGFDDRELWSLNYTIARFVAPRLKAFSENVYSIPMGMTVDEWKGHLLDMLAAF